MTRTAVHVPPHSNVPRVRGRRAAQPAEALSHAAAIVVVAFGTQAHAHVRHILSLVTGSAPSIEIRPDSPDDLAEFETALRNSSVGVRVLIAGSEHETYAARAAARRAGAMDEELVLEVMDDGNRRVYCAHCRAVSVVEAVEGDVIACAGCSLNLVVYYHFSALKGAYLGYMVDAEEAR